MNHKKFQLAARIATAIYALTLLLSTMAFAGQMEHPGVQISGMTATCSFVGARYNNNSNEFCLCRLQVLSIGNEPYAVCEAEDQGGVALTCYSNQPAYVDAVVGVRPFSQIEFTAVEQNGDLLCGELHVSTHSKHLPVVSPAP